jgi:hypothetical protein
MNQQRFTEAIGYLGQAVREAGEEERGELLALLAKCSGQLHG